MAGPRCWLREARFVHGWSGGAEGELHSGLVKVPVEIHRHAIHLQVEQIVHLVLVKERAPIDRADARHARFRCRKQQTQVCEPALAIETVSQFELLRQPRGADLDQPVTPLAQGANLRQQGVNSCRFKYTFQDHKLLCCVLRAHQCRGNDPSWTIPNSPHPGLLPKGEGESSAVRRRIVRASNLQ